MARHRIPGVNGEIRDFHAPVAKAGDWETLKAQLAARKVRVVALDLPTSWTMATTGKLDEFTARMFEAINGMMLDMLAAIARRISKTAAPAAAARNSDTGKRLVHQFTQRAGEPAVAMPLAIFLLRPSLNLLLPDSRA